MRTSILICILLLPMAAGANPVLDNLNFVKYMADLSEACRSEIRMHGKKDRVCWILDNDRHEMETLTERWKSLTQEEDDEVREYSERKPLNLIHMRENYKKYQENMRFIRQVD